MPKPQDIFQLARQEAVRVTASPQAWQSFLYTAAHNYHTTYLNQLLIHVQRPDAAACASMEYWNTKANRLVMCGSRSITVLQRRQGVAVTKPVFAIGDTTPLSQTRTGGPWEVTDITRPLLLQDMQTAKDSQSYDKDGKLVFSIELDGTSYDKREDAGKALLGLVGAAVRADHPVLVGHYAGFEVTVAYVPLSKVFVAHLVGQATHTTELGSDAAGNMVRLQNVVAALPQEVSGLRNNLQQLRVQLDSAKEELQQPFLQEQELNDKSARLAELDALLNVGNDAPVLEGEAEVVNEDDSVRTPREENELER